MTTHHTPSPWKWDSDDGIISNDTLICEVIGSPFDRPNVREANARLIAAAPTMLATLQACLEAMGDYYDAHDAAGDEGSSLHDLIESTIHQATQP